jgi:hypothetical protein
MIGGLVTSVSINLKAVLVTVTDKGESIVRGLPLNDKTRCIGIGDAIWWQGKRYFWTPQGSSRTKQGKDFDIIIEWDEVPV